MTEFHSLHTSHAKPVAESSSLIATRAKTAGFEFDSKQTIPQERFTGESNHLLQLTLSHRKMSLLITDLNSSHSDTPSGMDLHPLPNQQNSRSQSHAGTEYQLPRMARLKQQFQRPQEPNLRQAVFRELAALQLEKKIAPGQTVAITAGSRGISGIDVIIKGVVEFIRGLNGIPFIIPAMGSHGGATAEGQLAVLAGYGITPATMGCEIRSSMATTVVGETKDGIPIHVDQHALTADHVLVVNRIKPHTGFVGEIESGLHKMLLIGLGKHLGATVYHQAIVRSSFRKIWQEVAPVVISKARVVAGLGIVENAFDETALIAGVPVEEFAEKEAELLKLAKAYLPRLPFSEIDLLIVDQIGKNISGTGMDTNIVGRKYNDHAATPQDDVSIRRIFVRGLTAATHGNATGIGIAEFTNHRTVASIDREITQINCVTASHPTGAMIPASYQTDRQAIQEALKTIGWVPPHQAKVIQIRDTLHLGELLVSEAFAPELANHDQIEQVTDWEEMEFDQDDNLRDLLPGE